MLVNLILILYLLGVLTLCGFFAFEMIHIVFKKEPPFISTEKKVYGMVYNYLQGRDNLTYIEVGSGSGKGLRIMAQNPTWNVLGYEVAPRPYLKSRILNRLYKAPQIKVNFQDIFKASLTEADVVYCYLLGTFNEKLEIKLMEDLKPGSLIFSYAFTFPNLELVESLPVRNARHSFLHVYKR